MCSSDLATIGEVRINGKNIREYELTSLRKSFGVYFQNGANFDFSLRENIGLDENLDDAVCAQVLERCGGSDVLKSCGGNLDIAMGRSFEDDGLEFSIGQKQKIAIARALCREKSCYVLDEPSSSLDPEAENMVYDYIRERSRGKITIFTSHRLSFVKFADSVLVIEEGVLIEHGRPKELLKQSGRFSELYHMQEKQ